MRRLSLSFRERKIKFLQELAWWVTELTLWGKSIELDNFNSDILSDTIEESQLNFKDTRYGKEYLSNTK